MYTYENSLAESVKDMKLALGSILALRFKLKNGRGMEDSTDFPLHQPVPLMYLNSFYCENFEAIF